MDAKEREAFAGLIEGSCAIEGEPGHESVVLFHEPIVMERIEALISSALSAQAAEVERLRGGIKLGMIYADIVRGGASKEETQSEAERDYARLAALLPPAAQEVEL